MGQRLTARDVPRLEEFAAGSRMMLTSEQQLLAVAEWRDGVVQYLRVLG
jgi:hypothetical protein